MKYIPSSRQLIMPPANQYDAAFFEYHDIEEAVNQYYSLELDMIEPSLEEYGDQFWQTLTGEQAQRYLPVLTFMIQSVVTTEQKQHWTRQYSLASARIYGKPEASEVRRLACRSYHYLKNVADKNGQRSDDLTRLFDTYRSICDGYAEADSTDDESDLLRRISEILNDNYGDIYAVVDDEFNEDSLIKVNDVQRLYSAMLERMAAKFDNWSEWSVVIHAGAQMSVSPVRRQIRIGRHLPSLPAKRVKSLFTHEVLVHAARAVGGLPYTEQLAYGMPGYSESEEGLGVLMEAAIEGGMPHRVVDRYIDIALALGMFDMPALSRQDLFKIALARTKLRQIDAGLQVEEETTNRAVWQHVNRIYRGTLGNEIIGVMTRDVIYYHGYKAMADYLERYRTRDLRQALRFVLSSKINPVDQDHRAYFHAVKFNIDQGDA